MGGTQLTHEDLNRIVTVIKNCHKNTYEADRNQPLTTDIGSRVIRWGVGILEDAGCIIGYQSPIGRATIDKYTEDIAVDSRLIQRELGFKPQFDLKTGWQETVEEMRGNGK